MLAPLRRDGVKVIAITSDANSTLARHADVHLDGWVREEACPHDLAPTTSTTVALAIGDALAVALLEVNGFAPEDFARLHPGGALGRRLLLRVGEVMIADALPLLGPDAVMRDAIVVLAEKRGIAIVADSDRRIRGVLTTGDLTRLLERDGDVMNVRVDSIMTQSPRTAVVDELASGVVYRMEQFGVIAMPVLDGDDRVAGVVHLHDLMRAGAA